MSFTKRAHLLRPGDHVLIREWRGDHWGGGDPWLVVEQLAEYADGFVEIALVHPSIPACTRNVEVRSSDSVTVTEDRKGQTFKQTKKKGQLRLL